MSQVFLARQVALGRLVAIKLLGESSRVGDSPGRFRREAELLGRLNHPSIVSIHDSGHLGDRPYLVMEYIPGDLRAQLRPGKPLAIAQARTILATIAEALQFLHEHGIVHRDLKPENVLMAGPTTPKVADFGIAALLDELHGEAGRGRGLGTPGYVAPEQQYNLPTDERADQYSLAAVAYELLTGEPPLGTIRPPSTLRSSLGTAVDRVLLRALQDDPDDRFASIAEFAKALDDALARTTRTWARRLLMAAAGALALFTLGGSALLARRHGPDTRPPAPLPIDQAETEAARPEPSVAARPATIEGAIGIQLVRIPPGEFWMGAEPDDPSASAAEKPRRLVQIDRPPLVAAHEVTAGQFRTFVEQTGYVTTAEKSGGVIFDMDKLLTHTSPSYTWKHPTGGAAPGDDLPVTQVSHDDARAFCEWLTKLDRHRTGFRYRLLTEPEWEYACRAGGTGRWCFGNDQSRLSEYAHYLRKRGSSRDGPFPVGQKRPNAFGLYDMHGNVGEWCQEALAPYPGAGVAEDEGVADDPRSPFHQARRAIRGGCWTRGGKQCRSSARLAYLHTYAHYAIGFRVGAVEPNEP